MPSLEAAWELLVKNVEAAQSQAVRDARAKVLDELNQAGRRLKQYQQTTDWFDAVIDAAGAYASKMAVFSIENEELICHGSRGLSLDRGTKVPLAGAAGFRSACDQNELAVVLCTPTEISDTVHNSGASGRAYVVPISNGTRVAALLFAVADEHTHPGALELVANLGSFVLERRTHNPTDIIQIAANGAASEPRPQGSSPSPWRPPTWELLSQAEKLTHVRAQRMARTRVAEIQLYRPEAFDSGRLLKDLYLFLKKEIDSAREAYRTQFMSTPSMVDYLHLELLSQLAGNDETLLGAEYPGQMV